MSRESALKEVSAVLFFFFFVTQNKWLCEREFRGIEYQVGGEDGKKNTVARKQEKKTGEYTETEDIFRELSLTFANGAK